MELITQFRILTKWVKFDSHDKRDIKMYVVIDSADIYKFKYWIENAKNNIIEHFENIQKLYKYIDYTDIGEYCILEFERLTPKEQTEYNQKPPKNVINFGYNVIEFHIFENVGVI